MVNHDTTDKYYRDILLLVFRCRGRGDGILTVGDGGQAPVNFALSCSCSIPQHPTMPASHPIRDPQRPKLHTGNTDELRGGQAPGRGAGEETAGGSFLAVSILLTPPLYKTAAMHSSLKPWPGGSGNTHRVCDEYQ